MLLYNTVGRGTYWRALHLARGLARQGVDSTVVATSRTARLRIRARPDSPGVTVVETPDLLPGPLRTGWDLGNVLARIQWLRRQDFDLVHIFESRPTALFPGLYVQRRRKVKLVMDWCDWFGRGGSVEERPNAVVRLVLRPVETFFEERFRSGAEGTTVINSVLRQRAVELGVPPESIFHLPNGSNVEEIQPVPLAEARKRLGWSLHAPVVGYIGAIFERDAKLMARSFDQIHHQEPAARLMLAGYCNIPVEELVHDPTAVVRTGPIPYDQVGHYLSACNVCWLPLADSGANRGRYPLKLNDYMAAGRPVVATAVGDVPELIHWGQFGLVTRDRPDELAEAVIALFRAPEKAEEMGHRARLLAEEELTWDKVSDSLLSFYRRVLSGSV
jgi:glycosyltransferase involved in cell wall biosynthesis